MLTKDGEGFVDLSSDGFEVKKWEQLAEMMGDKSLDTLSYTESKEQLTLEGSPVAH